MKAPTMKGLACVTVVALTAVLGACDSTNEGTADSSPDAVSEATSWDTTTDGGEEASPDTAPSDAAADASPDAPLDAAADSEPEGHAFIKGTAVRARAFNGEAPAGVAEQYRITLEELFEYGVMETMGKMWAMRPSRDGYFWDDIDATLSWFEDHGLKLKYHTLVWDHPAMLPSWYTTLPTTTDRRNALEAHIRTVVSRYKGRIGIYDVVNHPFMYGDRDDYMATGWTVDEVVVRAFTWAREEDPQATLLINEGNIILDPEGRAAYIALVSGAISAGAPIDGIGFMGHFPSKLPNDAAIEQFISELAAVGVPVYITEFDMDPPESPGLPFDDYDTWWSYQAYAYRRFFEVVGARQDVGGLFMWGFHDGAHWKPGAGLFDVNFDPKPVYYTLEPLLTR